jgi:exopolysaccharide biosynthesis polyprenyl glycosylphosphotransferase
MGNNLRRVGVWLIDVVCALASYWLAYSLYVSQKGLPYPPRSTRDISTIFVVILLFMVTLFDFATNRDRTIMKRTAAQELWSVIVYNAMLLVGVIIAGFVVHVIPVLSRLITGYLILFNILLMFTVRQVAKTVVRRVFKKGSVQSGIVIITERDLAPMVERRFYPGATYRVMGMLMLDGKSLTGEVRGARVETTLGGLSVALSDSDVADVFICAPSIPQGDTADLIDAVERLGATCHVAVNVPDSGVERADLGYFGEMPAITYAGRGSKIYQHFFKRILDIIFSLIVVIIMLIPGAIICLLIAIQSKGAPFYSQSRLGLNGKHFKLMKFRSMVADADNVQKYLSPEQLEQWERERKIDDDPRVTSLGRFLRKTSLDEFPQFLNVLAGQMSVVGPRPIVDDELHHFGLDADEFLSCKPGITGWWQVEARNQADYESGERQKLELYYVRHVSFKLDWTIVGRTVGAVFHGTGK